MPETSSRHVFVYGTLRQGQTNDIGRLRPAPRFVGVASVRGTLFHLGLYPGVVLGGAGVVRGEVYEISRALERRLDLIEEVSPEESSSEYRRRFIEVRVAGRTLECLVYEINPRRVQGRPVISSGDWVTG